MAGIAKMLLGLNPGHKKKDVLPQGSSEKKMKASRIVSPSGRHTRRINISDKPMESFDDTSPHKIEKKSKETKEILLHAFQGHFLFSTLEAAELESILDYMYKEKAPANKDVLTQGDTGDKFYVLESGSCSVIVNGERVGVCTPGSAFGELALLYNCPRAATIVATEDSTLWTLERSHFRRILAAASTSDQVSRRQFLRNVKVLEGLSNYQIDRLADALTLETFEDKTTIIKQGDDGDKFYIIKEGSVKCFVYNGDSENELGNLGPGEYFGEMALLLNEPRHANCVAKGGRVVCYTLDKEKFSSLLGSLKEVLNRNMRLRVLRGVPPLAGLSEEQLEMVSRGLRIASFKKGQKIIRQGKQGNTFYIINEGLAQVIKDGMEIMTLKPGDFFGERALIKKEPRAADVVAIEDVECLTIDRDTFVKLIGDLNEILEKELQRQTVLQQRALTRSLSTTETEKPEEPVKKVELTTFKFSDLRHMNTVGTGTFGRVKLVTHKGSGKVMALKCMQKAQIVAAHQQKNVMNEKNIVISCDHPFVLKLFQTFADRDRLYMLLELVQGGELWTVLYEKTHLIPRSRWGGFEASAAKFYAANVVEAFRYLNSKGIAYRDLKPENLLLDDKGYLKVVDFGFAKPIPFQKKGGQVCQKSFTLCGTPEYLAPELVLSKGHNRSVDHWALGCLIYELLVGNTPFQDSHQPKIFEKIIHSNRTLKFPVNFDPKAEDLIRKLLNPSPALRLGSLAGGFDDIVNHPWFGDISFNDLVGRKITAPFVPQIKDPTDTSNFDFYPEEHDIVPYKGPQNYFEGF